MFKDLPYVFPKSAVETFPLLATIGACIQEKKKMPESLAHWMDMMSPQEAGLITIRASMELREIQRTTTEKHTFIASIDKLTKIALALDYRHHCTCSPTNGPCFRVHLDELYKQLKPHRKFLPQPKPTVGPNTQ